MRRAIFASALMGAAAVTACSDEAPVPQPSETAVPEELEEASPPVQAEETVEQSGTPMAERVATIGLLNKRNNLSEDFEMTPGDTRRSGNVMIRLEACERTAPYEMPQEVGAFVQVSVRNRGSNDFERVFSGWLFKNSPSLNVVEHPIYDVWVKDCAMTFPEED